MRYNLDMHSINTVLDWYNEAMRNKVILILIVLAAFSGGYKYATNKSSTTENSPISQQAPKSNTNIINLSDKNLSSISKDILDNKSVTKLDVSGNNLTGALPAEIRKLVNLEVLEAANNKMSGVPAEIGQLSRLKTANFANNDLSGLPLEIGNLKKLETLDLRGNPNISKHDIGLIQNQIPNAKIITD